jgi:hypothetical protein
LTYPVRRPLGQTTGRSKSITGSASARGREARLAPIGHPQWRSPTSAALSSRQSPVQVVSAATATAIATPSPLPPACCPHESRRCCCYCCCWHLASRAGVFCADRRPQTADRRPQPLSSCAALRPPPLPSPPHPCTPLHPALPLSALQKDLELGLGGDPLHCSCSRSCSSHTPYAIRHHPRACSRQALQNRPSKKFPRPSGLILSRPQSHHLTQHSWTWWTWCTWRRLSLGVS